MPTLYNRIQGRGLEWLGRVFYLRRARQNELTLR